MNHLNGYDTSTMNIAGGTVPNADAYHTSTVNMSSGSIGGDLSAHDTSSVSMSGGSVGSALAARDTSSVSMSGGSAVGWLDIYEASSVSMSGGSVSDYISTHDTSTVSISGGSMNTLYAYGTSTVTFHAREFNLGTGLSLDGDKVLGKGILSGEWFDGTPWTVNIVQNYATILAIPEPATLSLLALLALSLPKRGGLALLRRKSGYGG